MNLLIQDRALDLTHNKQMVQRVLTGRQEHISGNPVLLPEPEMPGIYAFQVWWPINTGGWIWINPDGSAITVDVIELPGGEGE